MLRHEVMQRSPLSRDGVLRGRVDRAAFFSCRAGRILETFSDLIWCLVLWFKNQNVSFPHWSQQQPLGEFGWSILDNYQLLAAPVMGIDLKESRPLTTVKTESRSDFTCSPCYHLLNVIKMRETDRILASTLYKRRRTLKALIIDEVCIKLRH